MDFANKTTVITGGATGIGFALAKILGLRGSRIILFEPREQQLQKAVQLLGDEGIDAKYHIGDVTKRADVEALADFAWSENGRADAVINNAGIGGQMQKVIDFDLEEARKLFEVNYWGMWNGIQVFGQRFIADGQPSAIYSVASENSLFNVYPSGGGAYVSSKHAIFGLMDMLRKEVPDLIETGCIIPGWVATEMTRLKGMDADEYAATIVPQMEAGEYYLVSHSYNVVRLDERYDEVKASFARYAPRYDGDDEYDVISAFAKSRAAKQKT
jgi:NAD(P)-dependent dehydrogenase (short-subunit alcohol dehydrogenase family)